MLCSSTPRESTVNGTTRRFFNPSVDRNPYSCLKKLLILLIFIYIGISTAIPGNTLIFIEKFTGSREDEVALIFSARAVGSLAGWLLGLLVLDMRNNFNPSNLMVIGASGLFSTYFLLIWATHIWWVMCGFAFQGAFLVVTTQGCLTYVRTSHLHFKPHWSQQMIFACLLGCVITPFVSFPFLQSSAPLPNPHSLSMFVLQNSDKLNNTPLLNVNPDPHLFGPVHLKRSSRAVVSTVEFVPIPKMNYSSNDSGISTSDSFTTFETSPVVIGNMTEGPPEYIIVSTVNTSTTVVPSSNVDTTVSAVPPSTLPMKPVVNDAKHLNQDSSSADGSQAASKMKQLGEERKIDTLAGVPTPPPPAVPVAVQEVTPLLQQVTVTSEIPKRISLESTTDNTTFASDIETTTNSSANVQADYQGGNATSDSSVFVVTSAGNNSSTSNLLRELSFEISDVSLTTPNAEDENGRPQSSSTVVPVPEIDLGGPKLFPNNSGDTKSLEPSNIMNSTATTPTITTTTIAAPSSTISLLPSTTHRKHIAEHRSAAESIRRRYLSDRLLPIQKVYLTLSLIGFVVWIVTLSLTKCCHSDCCATFGGSRRDHINDEVQLCRMGNEADDESDYVELSRSAVECQMLLPNRGSDVADSGYGQNVSTCDPVVNETLYVSADEDCLSSFSVVEHPNCVRTPCKKEAINSSSTNPPVQDVNLLTSHGCLVEKLRWPSISWPSDTSMLLAEFFNVGLETSYGAFIHGFTMRYLFWSPALAFLAVSLFWIGGLVGRLPGAFLFEIRRSMRSNRRLRFIEDPTISPAMHSTGSSPSEWLTSAVRLTGAVLCVLTATVLTRRSVSIDRYTVSTIVTTGIPSPLSRDIFFWLGGSLFLGLGVGVSSSPVGSVVAAQHSDNVHRLQLAGLLGQLFIPPLVAYVHHLAVFWRYTCVLSISALALGCLLSVALIANLIQIASRSVRTSNLHRPSNGTCQREPCKPTNVASNCSPARLHGFPILQNS